jgi:hypothetical protein
MTLAVVDTNWNTWVIYIVSVDFVGLLFAEMSVRTLKTDDTTFFSIRMSIDVMFPFFFSTHSKDLCTGEPWLPISMMVAGAFLISATAITALACGFRSNHHQPAGSKYPGKGSFWTIVWFFCCGLGTVIGAITWLGIWITSTYLTITTIQKLQVKHQVISSRSQVPKLDNQDHVAFYRTPLSAA